MHLDAVEYRDEAGNDVVLPTTMRYSTGTPCLELILEVPGSVWVRNESSNLHHIGFWSDSLGDQSGAFSAAGCPLQLCGRAGGTAPTSFAYHRDNDLGIRMELVDGVHARRHGVPLRAPTARSLTRGVLPGQRTEPLPPVPGTADKVHNVKSQEFGRMPAAGPAPTPLLRYVPPAATTETARHVHDGRRTNLKRCELEHRVGMRIDGM